MASQKHYFLFGALLINCLCLLSSFDADNSTHSFPSKAEKGIVYEQSAVQSQSQSHDLLDFTERPISAKQLKVLLHEGYETIINISREGNNVDPGSNTTMNTTGLMNTTTTNMSSVKPNRTSKEQSAASDANRNMTSTELETTSQVGLTTIIKSVAEVHEKMPKISQNSTPNKSINTNTTENADNSTDIILKINVLVDSMENKTIGRALDTWHHLPASSKYIIYILLGGAAFLILVCCLIKCVSTGVEGAIGAKRSVQGAFQKKAKTRRPIPKDKLSERTRERMQDMNIDIERTAKWY